MKQALMENVSLAPFLRNYMAKAKGPDVLRAMTNALERADAYFGALPDTRAEYRYAPGKWSIKEVVQHINDAERIFAYRALRFARHDSTVLPAFEEDDYALAARADRRTLSSIIEEHHLIRACSVALFRSFEEPMLELQGTAGGNSTSVEALGWIIAGHAEHHIDILEQRYS